MDRPSPDGFLPPDEAAAAAARLAGFTAAFDAAPSCAPLDLLLEHWRDLCAAHGAPPPRRAFDPTAAPRSVLPHLVLSEAIDGGADFRHRLVGATVVEWFGFNGTGQTLSQMHDAQGLERVMPVYRLAHRADRPLLVTGLLDYWRDKDHVRIEALMLPFAETPAGPATHLLQGLAFGYG